MTRGSQKAGPSLPSSEGAAVRPGKPASADALGPLATLCQRLGERPLQVTHTPSNALAYRLVFSGASGPEAFYGHSPAHAASRALKAIEEAGLCLEAPHATAPSGCDAHAEAMREWVEEVDHSFRKRPSGPDATEREAYTETGEGEDSRQTARVEASLLRARLRLVASRDDN